MQRATEEKMETKLMELSRLPLQKAKKLSTLSMQAFHKAQELLSIQEEDTPLQPASLWLMDHYPYLEETLFGLNREIKSFSAFPCNRKGSRALGIMQAAADTLDGMLDADSIENSVKSYQKNQGLSMQELWALPFLAKYALMQLIEQCAKEIVQRQEEAIQAKNEAAHWLQSGIKTKERRCKNLYPAKVQSLYQIFLQEEAGTALIALENSLRKQKKDLSSLLENAKKEETLCQYRLSNAIKSLKKLEGIQGEKLFMHLSYVEQTLSKEKSGIYLKSDEPSRVLCRNAIEKIARHTSASEWEVAKKAKELSDQGKTHRDSHVGYYLLQEGQKALVQALGKADFVWRFSHFVKKHAIYFFFAYILLFSYGIGILLFLLTGGIKGSLFAIFASVPVLSFLFRLLHKILPHLTKPESLEKLDFSKGIDPAYRTTVVVPTLLSSKERTSSMIKQLEKLYFCLPDPQVQYVLLGDFADSETEENENDQKIVTLAKEGIQALNLQYGDHFFYLHRKRTKSVDGYMGFERKRGALKQYNEYLLFEDASAFPYTAGPIQLLCHAPFVLTLDADTTPAPGSIEKLIGALAHPANAKTCILAPRMTSLPKWTHTHLQKLLCKGAIDVYGSAMSDLYQDLFGEGGFSGKGIYRTESFYLQTKDLPEQQLLSHDLIEGLLCKAALVNDIEFFDDAPATIQAFVKREHRWTRGDWQLVPFLTYAPFHALDKFRILDNLRRSLVPLSCILCLFLYPWLGLLVLGFAFGFLPSSGWLIDIALTPVLAIQKTDAAIRALFRTYVSRKNLLAWVTAYDSDKQKKDERFPFLGSCLLGGILSLNPLLFIFWAGIPVYLRYLGEKAYPQKIVGAKESVYLLDLAKRTYSWFTDFATEEEHFLPPDNVQCVPEKHIAHRTSPTNIGFKLCADIVAWDMGWINEETLALRLEQTLQTMEALQTHDGQFYNWYDTCTLLPLQPRYVSSVDNGNLAACLYACIAALRVCNQETLAQRAKTLLDKMDFSFLYQKERQLFYIGYDCENQAFGEVYYDLLSSESRLLSFLAIVKGDVPYTHFFHLGRPCVKTKEGSALLLSWSGTMFEYLMPLLFLQNPPEGILEESSLSAVRVQKRQPVYKNMWGVSESAYATMDADLNYQYKAFGIEELALKGILPKGMVLAPYAATLALMVDKQSACDNLLEMEKQGYGNVYGFFDAIDFTRERLPENRQEQIVYTQMAHHQGMTLLALEQVLQGKFVKRLMQQSAVQAYLPLLSLPKPGKKMPRFIHHAQNPSPIYSKTILLRAKKEEPLGHLLEGGGTVCLWLNDGGGMIRQKDVLLTSSQRQAQSGGILLFVKIGNEVFRLHQPCALLTKEAITEKIQKDGLTYQIRRFCSPTDGAFCVQVMVDNKNQTECELSIFAYCEPSLLKEEEDGIHPAYSDLFLLSQGDGNLLLCRRNLRESRKNLYLALSGGGDGTSGAFTTDRMNFLGRNGSYTLPKGILEGSLNGFVGAMVTPCMALSRNLKIKEKEKKEVCFTLLRKETKEETLSALSPYQFKKGVESAWQLVQMCGQIEGVSKEESKRFLHVQDRLLYLLTHPYLAGGMHKAFVAQNKLPLSALWHFGISGDLPLVTVYIQDMEGIGQVKDSLLLFREMQKKQFSFDLVICHMGIGDYQRAVQEKILELISGMGLRSYLNKKSGIYLLEGKDIQMEERILLNAASACIFNQDEENLLDKTQALPLPIQTKIPSETKEAQETHIPFPPMTEENHYGGFMQTSMQEGKYLIHTLPPQPWSWVLAGEHFGTLFTTKQGGYTYMGNAQQKKLTPWSNDPVMELSTEGFYLREEESGKFLPAFQQVIYEKGLIQGKGQAEGIEISTRIVIDEEKTRKLTQVTLKNLTQKGKSVSLTGYARWVLGESMKKTQGRIHVYQRGSAAFASLPDFDGLAYLNILEGVDSVCLDYRIKEISPYLTTLPESQGEPGALLRKAVTLDPWQSKTLTLILGWCKQEKTAFSPVHESIYLKDKELWQERLRALQVRLPDKNLQNLINHFLPYQAWACRILMRGAFYQTGGAWGFRDQLQDACMLGLYEPALLKQIILKCASRQFEEGDVLHWWHEPAQGVRTRITDDLLFLPYSVLRYISITGDRGILDEILPYLEGESLQEKESDRYASYTVSEKTESLYGHCLRAITHAMHFGVHGLPYMGSGDWNDGMNLVGKDGGESIFVGFLLLTIIEGFLPYMKEEKENFVKSARMLRENLIKFGWDGHWFRRAFFADGTILGSSNEKVCEIDLLTQAWAVFADMPQAYTQEALTQAFSHLYDERNKTLALLSPPFEKEKSTNPIGYIEAYVPGIRENGGQYTHAAAWFALALTKLGRWEEAEKIVSCCLGLGRDAEQYKVEPYVCCADIYTGQRNGQGGWSWYTGSAAWVLRAVIEGLCGLQMENGKARLVKPQGARWEQAEITLNGQTLTWQEEKRE